MKLLGFLLLLVCVTMVTSCGGGKKPKKPRHSSCPVDDKRKTCTMDGMIVCEGFVKFSKCKHDATTEMPRTTVDLEFCGINNKVSERLLFCFDIYHR